MSSSIPVIYHPIYSDLTLPDKHRYPIQKYRLLHDALLIDPSLNADFHVIAPQALSISEVLEVHDQQYIEALFTGQLPAAKMRRIGFPWSEALITRTLTSAGGTWETVQQAMKNGIAIHFSGGYHHAHRDFGSGFCLINDLAIAASLALQLPKVDNVMIIDLDVHHGDGTATITSDKPNIITVSAHCDSNFPSRKPQSSYDLPFEKQCEDQQYLATLKQFIPIWLMQHQPDIVIYDAGVDVHIDDELGYLHLSESGIYHRDKMVLEYCQSNEIPVAAVIGGGYHTNQERLIPLHLQLLNAAQALNAEKALKQRIKS